MDNNNSDQPDRFLVETLERIVRSMENDDGSIVNVVGSKKVAQKIAKDLLKKLPHLNLTSAELSGLGSLTYHAINNESFFDWEMPTLTGYKSEEFKKIIEKIPKI